MENAGNELKKYCPKPKKKKNFVANLAQNGLIIQKTAKKKTFTGQGSDSHPQVLQR